MVLLLDYMIWCFLVNIMEGLIFCFEFLEVFLYFYFDNIFGVFIWMWFEKKNDLEYLYFILKKKNEGWGMCKIIF